MFHLHSRLCAVIVINVIWLIVLQQAYANKKAKPVKRWTRCVGNPLLTFDDELVVENTLKWSQQERVERKVAHFASLKVAVNLLKRLITLERLFQFFKDKTMFLYVPIVKLQEEQKENAFQRNLHTDWLGTTSSLLVIFNNKSPTRWTSPLVNVFVRPSLYVSQVKFLGKALARSRRLKLTKLPCDVPALWAIGCDVRRVDPRDWIAVIAPLPAYILPYLTRHGTTKWKK